MNAEEAVKLVGIGSGKAMTEKKKISGIKIWPEDGRPREKLFKKGTGALINSEFLAILLRAGIKGTSVP